MLSQPAKLTLEVNTHVCRSSYSLPRGIEWCLASVEKHQSLFPVSGTGDTTTRIPKGDYRTRFGHLAGC